MLPDPVTSVLISAGLAVLGVVIGVAAPIALGAAITEGVHGGDISVVTEFVDDLAP
ncbi:hypothetical protein ONR57_00390 [Hoyosella sp. YIM 151337]|uniref:hypothetical protein n=1 Tax=Hoyosella sp. YIM 151337 TaxID=2992742 RepID=UPI002235F034|nr:hypothetical protein [Hoyosella sp. YIM 151337]MCW4351760.1 hypothetical protein [Hoyosella sp. YIM 151337]